MKIVRSGCCYARKHCWRLKPGPAENETVLTSFERDFLEACQQAEQRAHAERERQEQAVKLQEQARLAGKLRQRLVLASVAAVIALGFFIAAAYFGYQATAQRDIARSLANENATNAFVAQAASTQAVANAITAEANAQLANAASTQASVDRGIALAASTQAVAGQATAVSAQETSVYNEQVAEEQARLASSRQLASQSLNYLNNQPSLAALLAVAAYQASDTNEAKNAMLNNIQNQVSQNIVNLSGPLPTQNNAVYSVALSPDGTRLAWGLSEGTVILWNLQTSQIEKSYKEHLDKVLSLQFSADGRWLVSGGNEGTTIFLDMQSGETFPLQTFTSTPATVYSLSISPDSSQLALTRSTDVYIYDITDPRNPVGPQRLVGHTTSTLAVAWSSDGSLLASAGTDLSVRVWDPGIANPVRVFSGHTGDVLGLSWSPDNNLLASASQDGSVIVWDVANGGQSGLPLRGSVFDFFYSVSFSRDGQFLAAGRGNGTIMIWTVADRVLFEEITLNQEIVNAVQFSPQPGVNLLASGSFDGKPGLFNIKTLAPLAQPVTDVVLPGAVRSLQVLENGDLTLLVENPSGVQVFNLQDGNFVGGVNLSGIYSSAALSTDGEIALLGTADGTALAVDTLSAGQTGFEASLNGSPMSLTLDPAAERVAASTGFSMVAQRPQDTLLSIFRYPAGELLSDPIPVPELMTTLAFDGSSSLITGSETGVIYQWNLNNNQQVGIPLERHLSATRALAIFEARRLLASGSDDRTLTLWDLTYGQALGPPLVGANDSILSLSFSADGTQLYSGGADGVVLLWDVDPVSWLLRLCQIAGRNLTESEWIQFMPESEPYQKVCPDFP
jgi:WD40 repeat protein